MATPYATAEDARNFYAGADASGATLRVPMELAADLVQRYAPVPSPITTDYPGMAANAELLVGAYLFETQGYLGGESQEGVSANYLHDGTIFRLVGRAMGAYAASVGRMSIRRMERA